MIEAKPDADQPPPRRNWTSPPPAMRPPPSKADIHEIDGKIKRQQLEIEYRRKERDKMLQVTTAVEQQFQQQRAALDEQQQRQLDGDARTADRPRGTGGFESQPHGPGKRRSAAERHRTPAHAHGQDGVWDRVAFPLAPRPADLHPLGRVGRQAERRCAAERLETERRHASHRNARTDRRLSHEVHAPPRAASRPGRRRNGRPAARRTGSVSSWCPSATISENR